MVAAPSLVVLLNIFLAVSNGNNGTPPPPIPSVVSEGSVSSINVAAALAAKPGSEPGFYNSKRRVGRDFCVLSVAQWLSTKDNRIVVPRLLDAHCASGIQGLRVAIESPLLAQALLGTPAPAELHVVLNDSDEEAVKVAASNAGNFPGVTVTQRVAQALLHEESFDISVLDPFGCTTPFLDAALARAPHEGLLEICATDVGALYGSRPAVAKRHYHATLSSSPRPPCFRERGVRLLIAAVAQAAARYDKGVEPILGVSTEHYCVVSLRIIRGRKGADAALKQVQPIRICSSCGAYGIGDDVPQCGCKATSANDVGVGTDAREEGPLWSGPLYDNVVINQMVAMSNLKEAEGLISSATHKLLSILDNEATVDSIFHRRPGVAAGGKTPKLDNVLDELHRRGYLAARTHFDPKALKTNASTREFDNVVKAVVEQATG